MNKQKMSRLLRAGTLLLAVLMVFGNLYLPSGTLKVSAEENKTLFSTDFEGEESISIGNSIAAGDRGWQLDGGAIPSNVKVEIKEVEGNKVLALTKTDSVTASKRFELKYDLFDGAQTDASITSAALSYRIYFTDKMQVFFPTVCGANDVNMAAFFGSNSGSMTYSTTGGSSEGDASWDGWLDLYTGGRTKTSKLTTGKWYTVKEIYTLAEGENPAKVDVYIDGVLTKTDLGKNVPTDIGGFVLCLHKWSCAGSVYIDDINFTREEPAVNEVIYATGFEETDEEKFAEGDFGIDATGANASTKYPQWSLNSAYDSTYGSIRIKKINGNQVLSVKNDCGTGGLDNRTIQLRRNGFGDRDEVWVSYNAAFSAVKAAAFLPSPYGSTWATYFGDNGGAWKWATKSGTWEPMAYTDGSDMTVETMKWYTVEVHYAKGDAAAIIEVYIDGKLTDAAAYASFNGQVNGLMLELNRWGYGECEMFIDNIQVSTQRHTPAATPASLVTETNEIIYSTGFETTGEGELFVNDSFGDFTSKDGSYYSANYPQWSMTTAMDPNCGLTIKTFNGNRVLSLTSNCGDKTNAIPSADIILRRDLDVEDGALWLSYNVAVTQKTCDFMPCFTGGSAMSVKFGTNVGKWNWRKSDNIEHDLTYVSSSAGALSFKELTWYTVELRYAGSSEGAGTVELYIDGKLTNAGIWGSDPMTVDSFEMKIDSWGIGATEMFVDDITVSTQRLADIQKPASLIEMNEVTDVTISNVELSPVDGEDDTYTMVVGDHGFAYAEVAPANADYQTILWTSGDSSVATVDSYGEILALSPGTTVITAASSEPGSELCDTITVVVSETAVMKTVPVASVAELKAALAEVASINANGGMTGNIEIVLADGYYYLTETLKLGTQHSGTNGYSVIIKAAENAEPVISGASVISGTWSKVDGKGYYAIQVPKEVDSRQLYVNDVRAVRARSESGLTNSSFIYDNGINIGYASKDIELASYKYPADLELVFKVNWTQPRCGVAQIIDKGNGTVNLIMDQPGWSGVGRDGKSVTNKGMTSATAAGPVWYENALELLDESGEWYLDTHSSEEYNILYYMPRPWEDMATAKVTMPTLDNSTDIEGADGALVEISGTFSDEAHNQVANQVMNIHFAGITFADTTWMRPSTSNGDSDAQNNHIREEVDNLPPAAVLVQAASAIWFADCTFTRLGINGLQMIDGVQNSLVIGNHFFDISGNAINIGEPDTGAANAHAQGLNVMKNNDILNNFIHNTGVDYGSSAAISVGFAADMDMNHNEIFDIPYSGWHIGYGWNNSFPNNTKNMILEYNFVHDLMGEGIYDGGAFYINGNTSGESYNYIRRNYIRNQMNAYAALYSDQGTSYFNFIENVIDLSETTSWVSGKPVWSHTHQAEGHIHYINNFSTTGTYTYKQYPGNKGLDEDISIGKPTVSANAGWTDAVALDVIANAGLESAYSSLRNGQVERFKVNGDEKRSLGAGGAVQLSVTASAIRCGKLVTEGLNYSCYYESEDPTVAEVDENGLIVGKGIGSTTVRVWVVSNNIAKVEEITVEVTDAVKSVVLNIDGDITRRIEDGGLQLTAVIKSEKESELTPNSMTFAVDDESIATVTADGYLTPVAVGVTSLTVTATYGSASVTGVFKVVITTDKVAMIGNVSFDTLEAALNAAETGDTILLVADVDTDGILLKNGVMLDLNGYTVEADYLVAFADSQVIDSVGGGLLKSRNVRLAADNAQMPVWVEADGGYRFFTMKDSQLYYSQSATGFVFIAKPVLGKAANAPYMALANNGLSVKARMSWKSAAGNDVEQFFMLKGEDVQKIYSDANQIIQLTVNGAGSYIGRLSTTMVIQSETGVIWSGVPLLYTGN